MSDATLEPQDMLTQAKDAGFFLLEGLLSDQECDVLAARLQEYASGSRKPVGRLAVHREAATKRRHEHHSDGSDVRKVSGLFSDDLFRDLISRDRVVRHLHKLLGKELRLFRADALMKPPVVGSEKGAHQDSASHWPIEPMSLWSCWIAFDDANEDNGCMRVTPGSHRLGALHHESIGDDYVIPRDVYDWDSLTAVPMRRGTGLFFHSLLVHGTAANTSARPRRAATLSYMGLEHSYSGNEVPAPIYPVVSVCAEGSAAP